MRHTNLRLIVWKYVLTERELNWVKSSPANYVHGCHSSCFVGKKNITTNFWD